MPLHAIAADFLASNGTKLSERTIQRYLHKNGIHSFVAAAKPYLSLKQIDARLNWSTERYMWNTQQWSIVAFTTDSSFTLRPQKNYARVWRREGKRYETQNMLPTFKSGFVSLSI